MEVRTSGFALLLLTVLTLAIALPAPAQLTGKAARERYKKHTKGTSIDDFVRKMDSSDPEERLDGVRSLAESGNNDAIEYLVQALGDADMRVRCKAVDGLGNLRATEGAPVLIQHLFLRTTDPALKQRILAALGKIGDPQAAGPIAEFLQRDLSPQMRGTAIFALGEIGSAESLPSLERMAEAEKDPRLLRLVREATTKIRYHQAMLKSDAKEPPRNFLRDKEQAPRR